MTGLGAKALETLAKVKDGNIRLKNGTELEGCTKEDHEAIQELFSKRLVDFSDADSNNVRKVFVSAKGRSLMM